MKRVFYWFIVAVGLTSVTRAEDVLLLDNQSEQPFTYQIRHAGSDDWSEPLALAQGRQHCFRARACHP
ncbi:MAG: hypothetical protein NTY19_06615 [Planctomycetota bacterium]|nr:hypothetical protein [Planctomycetota bacterium]